MSIDNLKTSEQYLLNWPTNEKFAHANFLSSLSNEKAVKLIDQWPNWHRGNENFYALIIYGPTGCGKTHLSCVWGDISKARKISLKQLVAHEFLESKNLVFILDDIDHYIVDPVIQEAFLHLYNWTREQGGYLLLTATKRPKEWGVSLKDLSSRLLSFETVQIKAPDDYLLRAVIIKQFYDLQITLSDDVLSYMVPRIERTFNGIRELVKNIDRLSRIEKKKISIGMVREVLNLDNKGY